MKSYPPQICSFSYHSKIKSRFLCVGLFWIIKYCLLKTSPTAPEHGRKTADGAIAVKGLRSRGEGGACRPRRENANGPPPLRGAVCVAADIPLPPAGAADVPGISGTDFRHEKRIRRHGDHEHGALRKENASARRLREAVGGRSAGSGGQGPRRRREPSGTTEDVRCLGLRREARRFPFFSRFYVEHFL